jgi:broad specificity phosphatase PhoE
MGQIYLVRHGQASFGAADYDQLSDLGTEQARMLGDWFANSGIEFSSVVTGGMKRHRQTADACCAGLPVPSADAWITEPGFDEYDHDDVLSRCRPGFDEPGAIRLHIARSKKPQDTFLQIFEESMQRWMGGSHDHEYRESWPAFRARCHGALQRLVETAGSKGNVVVFTSGGTIATLCQPLLLYPDTQVAALTWNLVNSSATKLINRGGRVTLSTLNSHAHLEQPGRAHAITYR